MLRRLLRRTIALVAGATLSGVASIALATPISGGVTTVTLDEAIAEAVIGAGVTPSAIGIGTLDGLTFEFPITGGDLSDEVIPGSTIEHDGSGIQFAAGDISLTIGDFLIDTTTLVISGFALSMNPVVGDAVDIPGGVPLFGLGINAEEGLPFVVSLTGTAASVLNDTFGTDLFSDGLRIGTAGTAPSVVSEPGVAGLLGASALALLLRRRRYLQSSV